MLAADGVPADDSPLAVGIMVMQGLDISLWQATTPDLQGKAFVFAKATEGSQYVDPMYATHAANIRKAGLALGAYHFGRAGDGAAQARHLLAVAPSADFYALDDEQDMTPAQANAFIAEFHRRGLKVGYYSYLSRFADHGQDWNWPATRDGVKPPMKWTFWQTRGDPLDLDVFAGDAAALAAFVANQRPKAPEGAIP